MLHLIMITLNKTVPVLLCSNLFSDIHRNVVGDNHRQKDLEQLDMAGFEEMVTDTE